MRKEIMNDSSNQQVNQARKICIVKKIRDDQNSRNQLEQYISNHSEAMFSHGVCPQCVEKHYSFTKKSKDS
jgi:hypothetical protein